jgi:hypothetical protein
MLAVRVSRQADAGAGVVAAHGENTAERSAYRDGSHTDRRYDCTSTHSESAILGPRAIASSPSYLVLTGNPFPSFQMTGPELSRTVTGGMELAASMTLAAEGPNSGWSGAGVREL